MLALDEAHLLNLSVAREFQGSGLAGAPSSGGASVARTRRTHDAAGGPASNRRRYASTSATVPAHRCTPRLLPGHRWAGDAIVMRVSCDTGSRRARCGRRWGWAGMVTARLCRPPSSYRAIRIAQMDWERSNARSRRARPASSAGRVTHGVRVGHRAAEWMLVGEAQARGGCAGRAVRRSGGRCRQHARRGRAHSQWHTRVGLHRQRAECDRGQSQSGAGRGRAMRSVPEAPDRAHQSKIVLVMGRFARSRCWERTPASPVCAVRCTASMSQGAVWLSS